MRLWWRRLTKCTMCVRCEGLDVNAESVGRELSQLSWLKMCLPLMHWKLATLGRALGVEAAVVVERKLDEPAVGQPVLELRRRHLERLARRVVRRPRRADEEAGVGERAGERPVVAPRHLSWQSSLCETDHGSAGSDHCAKLHHAE